MMVWARPVETQNANMIPSTSKFIGAFINLFSVLISIGLSISTFEKIQMMTADFECRLRLIIQFSRPREYRIYPHLRVFG